MFGAARLDAAIYEEVETNVTATGHAVVVIVLSSVATAIGFARTADLDLPLMVAYTTTALAAWLMWRRCSSRSGRTGRVTRVSGRVTGNAWGILPRACERTPS